MGVTHHSDPNIANKDLIFFNLENKVYIYCAQCRILKIETLSLLLGLYEGHNNSEYRICFTRSSSH